MPPENIFSFPQGLLSVTVLTPQLVRVRWAAGEFAPRRSWDVSKPAEEFEPCPVSITRTEASLHLDTGLFRVVIDRSTGSLACEDRTGRMFCADQVAPYPSMEVAVTKRVEPGEHFYGFGERGGSGLERSGRRMVNWTTDPSPPARPGCGPDVHCHSGVHLGAPRTGLQRLLQQHLLQRV